MRRLETMRLSDGAAYSKVANMGKCAASDHLHIDNSVLGGCNHFDDKSNNVTRELIFMFNFILFILIFSQLKEVSFHSRLAKYCV